MSKIFPFVKYYILLKIEACLPSYIFGRAYLLAVIEEKRFCWAEKIERFLRKYDK